jgi:hypothetical protein
MGQKQTLRRPTAMSALPLKADIDGAHSLGKLNAMRGLQKKRAQPDKAEPRT